jgi:hypothetical protein
MPNKWRRLRCREEFGLELSLQEIEVRWTRPNKYMGQMCPFHSLIIDLFGHLRIASPSIVETLALVYALMATINNLVIGELHLCRLVTLQLNLSRISIRLLFVTPGLIGYL